MFIDQGAIVDIVAGRLAGRFGVVEKIRIEDVSAQVFVGVRVFNPDSGNIELNLFEPIHLKRRRDMTPAQVERVRSMLEVYRLEAEGAE